MPLASLGWLKFANPPAAAALRIDVPTRIFASVQAEQVVGLFKNFTPPKKKNMDSTECQPCNISNRRKQLSSPHVTLEPESPVSNILTLEASGVGGAQPKSFFIIDKCSFGDDFFPNKASPGHSRNSAFRGKNHQTPWSNCMR